MLRSGQKQDKIKDKTAFSTPECLWESSSEGRPISKQNSFLSSCRLSKRGDAGILIKSPGSATAVTVSRGAAKGAWHSATPCPKTGNKKDRSASEIGSRLACKKVMCRFLIGMAYGAKGGEWEGRGTRFVGGGVQRLVGGGEEGEGGGSV